MGRQQDRSILIVVAVFVVGSLLLMMFYPPSPETERARHALLLLLLVGATANAGGLVLGVVTALSATVLFVGVELLGPGPMSWGDTLVDATLLTLVSSVLVGIVVMRRRGEEAALEHERESGVIAQIGVGFFPPALHTEAMGHMLAQIKRIANAECLGLLVPDQSGRLQPWPDLTTRHTCRSEEVVAVAQMLYEAGRSDRKQGLTSDGVLTLMATADEVYAPIVSATGSEGVLYAHREQASGRWSDRDTAFIDFAARLIGTLFLRDRLQEQAAAAQAIEEADRLKASFVSSVTHDLKTPVAAALATVTSMLDDLEAGDTTRVASGLRSVRDDVRGIDRRIGKLVDVSRLETASWTPRLEWNDVQDLCQQACSGFEDGRHRISCTIPEGTLVARFDLVQMARALYHMVENALVYSPEGAVVSIGADSDGAMVRIWVEDRGPGVRAYEREAIFGKFYRGTAGESVQSGTGLGLAVAAGIVAAHGGRIEVENVEPTGARFSLVFPIEG